MGTVDEDEFVVFQDVRVLRSTAPGLLCRIGSRSVWLPRAHINGKLWCTGDRGKLFIRRWVARDRQLLDAPRPALPPPNATTTAEQPPAQLYLVPRRREAHHVE